MPMYIESVPNRDSPPAVLLRESYREDGKVRKRTLANLSCLAADVIEGHRLAACIDGVFADTRIQRLHLHYAKPGCYACRVERA